MLRIFVTLLFALVAMPVTRAETPEQWVALLTRVHGGFGSFPQQDRRTAHIA